MFHCMWVIRVFFLYTCCHYRHCWHFFTYSRPLVFFSFLFMNRKIRIIYIWHLPDDKYVYKQIIIKHDRKYIYPFKIKIKILILKAINLMGTLWSRHSYMFLPSFEGIQSQNIYDCLFFEKLLHGCLQWKQNAIWKSIQW